MRVAGEGDPAAFHFHSRWELACLREQIWDALVDFHTWPGWWPGLDRVVEQIHGNADGIGQRAVSSWRGPAGYSLQIEIESVERVHPEFLHGVASGDVVGEGTWELLDVGTGWTAVEFDWNVRANRPWMEFLAPVARPIFISSHDLVMKRGAEGLAGYLECEIREFSARVR